MIPLDVSGSVPINPNSCPDIRWKFRSCNTPFRCEGAFYRIADGLICFSRMENWGISIQEDDIVELELSFRSPHILTRIEKILHRDFLPYVLVNAVDDPDFLLRHVYPVSQIRSVKKPERF